VSDDSGCKTVPEGVVARRIGDETVVVNMETSRMYTLNATASRTWELLREGLGESEVLDQLEAEFDVPREQLRRDVADLVADLMREGLLCTAET